MLIIRLYVAYSGVVKNKGLCFIRKTHLLRAWNVVKRPNILHTLLGQQVPLCFLLIKSEYLPIGENPRKWNRNTTCEDTYMLYAIFTKLKCFKLPTYLLIVLIPTMIWFLIPIMIREKNMIFCLILFYVVVNKPL